jgi:cell division protein FtsL
MRYGKRIVFGLTLCVLASAMLVVNARHESRLLFVALQGEKANRDDLNIEYGQLQLEEGTWGTHGRIEQKARTKLSMRLPQQGDVQILKP